MEIFLLNIRYRLILLTNQKTAWKDILLSREFFLIIIFVVNFNIIICYNLYGFMLRNNCLFNKWKMLAIVFLYNYPETTQWWDLIWGKDSIDQHSIVI